MCNFKHPNSKPIRKKGKGYKLFRLIDGEFRSWYLCGFYQKDSEGWVRWNAEIYAGDGFCFFLSKKEAIKINKRCGSGKSYIVPIEYENGVCKQIEHNMVLIPASVALCKKWRILE